MRRTTVSLTPSRLANSVFRIPAPRLRSPLAECRQCGLNSFGLCVVLRVKHAADNGFADAKPFGQLRISHSGLAHGQIEGKLGRQVERNADWILAALQLARDRNSVAARDPS